MTASFVAAADLLNTAAPRLFGGVLAASMQNDPTACGRAKGVNLHAAMQFGDHRKIASFASYCDRIWRGILLPMMQGMTIIMAAQIRLPISSIAIVSAFLVSTFCAVGSAGTARAADCLAAPALSAPPNGHWYYHTDRATQRKCWYLRGLDGALHEGETKTTQSASAASTYSLEDFKNFMARRGKADLSDKDVEQLYAEFLQWRHRSENGARAQQ
jgi:hypothetical protein